MKHMAARKIPWVITGAPGFASATMGNKYADDVSALVRIRGPHILDGETSLNIVDSITLCRKENDDHRENLRVTVILSNSHDSLSVIAYLSQHEKGMGVALKYQRNLTDWFPYTQDLRKYLKVEQP